MKRFCLIVFLLLFTTANSFSNQTEKREILKVLFQYPALDKFPKKEGDASVFWKFITEQNRLLNSYLAKEDRLQLKIRKKLEKDLIEINAGIEKMLKMDQASFEEDKLKWMLCGSDYKLIDIYIYNSLDPNAGMYPNGKTIISIGIMELLTPFEMIGILAHEMAHYYLRHKEVNLYLNKKRERRNNAWAAVAAVGVAAVGTYTQVLAAEAGTTADASWVGNAGTAIEAAVNDNTMRHYFKYSRVQEIEADMIACLFLDWIGIGREHFINALKKIRDYEKRYSLTSKTDEYSTHPDIEVRINTLSEFANFDLNKCEKLNKKEAQLLDGHTLADNCTPFDKEIYNVIKTNRFLCSDDVFFDRMNRKETVKSIKRLCRKGLVVREKRKTAECFYFNIELIK